MPSAFRRQLNILISCTLVEDSREVYSTIPQDQRNKIHSSICHHIMSVPRVECFGEGKTEEDGIVEKLGLPSDCYA